MVLTLQERFDLLYQGQERPTPSLSEITEKGIMDETWANAISPAPAKVTKQTPPAQSKETENRSQVEDEAEDDSPEEDEYLAACAANFKAEHVMKSGNTSHKQAEKASEPTPRNNDPYAYRQATNEQTKSNYDQSIPLEDPFGNQLLSQYCSLALVVVFPYKYIQMPLSDKVAKRYFDGGKIWQNDWEISYIHPPSYLNAKPILLVPKSQVQDLIDKINAHYKSDLVIPIDPSIGLTIPFYDDGTPKPIYIGRGRDRNHISEMEASIPRPRRGYGEAPAGCHPQLEQSFEAFGLKLEMTLEANKRRNKAIKQKRNLDRLQVQQKWSRGLKRAQRYLGLRCRITAPTNSTSFDPSLSWTEQQNLQEKEALASGRSLIPLDVTKPAPYTFEDSPIIIAIDIEMDERDHNCVTEVGVSTLDTMDLEGLPPGQGGLNWMSCIRSRHFRIAEYKHVVNTKYCPGDPEAFRFGTSEFVPLADIGVALDECFQWPFSVNFKHPGLYTLTEEAAVQRNLQKSTSDQQVEHDGSDSSGDPRLKHSAMRKGITVTDLLKWSAEQKGSLDRRIVLVGHDLQGDIKYFGPLHSTISLPEAAGPDGESIHSSIIEALDTSYLHRVLARDGQGRKLVTILYELGLIGLDVHNAGNDARYTLEAFIGIAVKDRVDEDKRKSSSKEEQEAQNVNKEAEIQRRVEEKRKEAEETIRTELAIWEAATGESRTSKDSLNDDVTISGDGDSSTTNQRSASWFPEDMIFSCDSDQDGGSAEGWQVDFDALSSHGSTKGSKKTASTKRREAEEWYHEYIKEQIAKNSIEEEITEVGSGLAGSSLN